MTLRICSNGHKYEKTSLCPVCPKCSEIQMKERFPVDFPKIGNPALRALDSKKIYNLSSLTKYTEEEMLDLHGFGPKALKILKSELNKTNRSFSKNRKIDR